MEAVILDMDGVLVDSEPLHLEAANKILAVYGVELSEAENAAYLGMDDVDFFSALKANFGLQENLDDLVSARQQAVIALIREGVVPRPGVPELIVGLKMRGLPMALGSSSPRVVVEAMLDELGLANSFNAVVTGDDVAGGKPAPHIFLLAAQRLGVAPADCIVFEDSLHGLRAARDAGMTPLAVRTRENCHLELHDAERVYDGLDRFDWAYLEDR